MVFANNDRPGIMLAGSLRAYANRWGVAMFALMLGVIWLGLRFGLGDR